MFLKSGMFHWFNKIKSIWAHTHFKSPNRHVFALQPFLISHYAICLRIGDPNVVDPALATPFTQNVFANGHQEQQSASDSGLCGLSVGDGVSANNSGLVDQFASLVIPGNTLNKPLSGLKVSYVLRQEKLKLSRTWPNEWYVFVNCILRFLLFHRVVIRALSNSCPRRAHRVSLLLYSTVPVRHLLTTMAICRLLVPQKSTRPIF